MTEQSATCDAVRPTNTATGRGEVRCTKPAGHVQAGDERHEGRTGEAPGMPVYWTDAQQPGHR